MGKASLYWCLVAIALFVLGPIAGPMVGELRAADGGAQVTPLTGADPAAGMIRAGLAFFMALVIGVVGSWAFGARVGMTFSGLVLAWCAFQSGRPDELIRRTHDPGVVWRLAMEGLVFGAAGLVLAALLLLAGRRHQPGAPAASDVPPERSRRVSAVVAGIGAGVGVGGLIAWLLAFETLKMQTIFAAGFAGIGVGAAAHLASSAVALGTPTRTAITAFVAVAVLAVLGPVSALAVSGGAGGVIRSAYDGGYFALAAPLALDWVAGALIGIPMGLAWSGAILDKSQTQ